MDRERRYKRDKERKFIGKVRVEKESREGEEG
jgi:hypothetical protein